MNIDRLRNIPRTIIGTLIVILPGLVSAALPGDYLGWLWETGVTNQEQDEELCFATLNATINGDLTWTLSSPEDICWGRRTQLSGRTFFNPPPHTTGTFMDQSTRSLVSAGGNLYELYGEEVDMGVGQGEERYGALLSVPSDDNFMMIGGFEEFDSFGHEYFGFLDLYVKATPANMESRTPADLQNTTWRVSWADTYFDSLNVEGIEASIDTVALLPGNQCSFAVSTVFPDFVDNVDFYETFQSDDGNNLTNRNVEAGRVEENASSCTYTIDVNGYLEINATFTLADDPLNPESVTIRFVVADDNRYVVLAPMGTGNASDNETGILAGYRAASGMTTDDIDGTYLFHLVIKGFDGSGTGSSYGGTQPQEFDGFVRGKLSFNSAQAGTTPPGESGSWFTCEMELVLNEEERWLSGTVNSDLTISGDSFHEGITLTSCDYKLDTDGALRLYLTNVEPGDPEVDAFFLRGYVNDNAELFSLLGLEIDAGAPMSSFVDFAEIIYALGIRYTGNLNADADEDGFTNLEEFQIPLAPPDSVKGDLGGDGKSDILWRNGSSGVNWLYQMDGATISAGSQINTTSDLNWKIVGTGDADSDGMADILWRNASSGANWLYLMNGSTISMSQQINTVSDPNWEIVGNGDYDGDGKADILWRNKVTGQNWMYLMDGATRLSSLGVNTVSDLNWKVQGSGDHDGDGKADILWRNTATGLNWLYIMSGATITTSAQINTVSDINWKVVGNGDANGDGMADILWRNAASGSNYLYLMNGATISSSNQVNTVSDLNWEIVANGDYNGDTKADILWRNKVTGSNWMYLMDGATRLSSLGVNTVSDLDYKVVHIN